MLFIIIFQWKGRFWSCCECVYVWSFKFRFRQQVIRASLLLLLLLLLLLPNWKRCKHYIVYLPRWWHRNFFYRKASPNDIHYRMHYLWHKESPYNYFLILEYVLFEERVHIMALNLSIHINTQPSSNKITFFRYLFIMTTWLL